MSTMMTTPPPVEKAPPQPTDHPLLFESGAVGNSAAALPDSDVPHVDAAAAIGTKFLRDRKSVV